MDTLSTANRDPWRFRRFATLSCERFHVGNCKYGQGRFLKGEKTGSPWSLAEGTMSRFDRISTPIAGLTVVERQRRGDDRGFFSRFFCREALADFGGDGKIAQINHTLTQAAGTIRGLHFQQAPHDEAKFVSCLSGAVFDVAVDLRPDSATYLQWHGEVLSADNGRSMMIPGGFAHGFQTLTEDCELIYLHDKPYAPEAEGGLNPLDPGLAIAWPLPVSQMSPRDQALPLLPNRIVAARR